MRLAIEPAGKGRFALLLEDGRGGRRMMRTVDSIVFRVRPPENRRGRRRAR